MKYYLCTSLDRKRVGGQIFEVRMKVSLSNTKNNGFWENRVGGYETGIEIPKFCVGVRVKLLIIQKYRSLVWNKFINQTKFENDATAAVSLTNFSWDSWLMV